MNDAQARLQMLAPHEPAMWRQLVHDLDARSTYFLVGGRKPPKTPVRLLNLGCGPHICPGWVNADYHGMIRRMRSPENAANWLMDATREWRCPSNYWEGIFCQHVIEHFDYPRAVYVLSECFRTLQRGCWLRLSVPDIDRYIGLGTSGVRFGSHAEAISTATQHFRHLSTWSASLMIELLKSIGFASVEQVGFQESNDRRLLVDDPSKEWESLYVEARRG